MGELRNKKKSLVVENVAKAHGVQPNYVYKVIAGDRSNESIMSTYVNLMQSVENLLMDAVLQACPFDVA